MQKDTFIIIISAHQCTIVIWGFFFLTRLQHFTEWLHLYYFHFRPLFVACLSSFSVGYIWIEECLTQYKRYASLLSHKTWKVGSLAGWNVNPSYFRHIRCDGDTWLWVSIGCHVWVNVRWMNLSKAFKSASSSLQINRISCFICMYLALNFLFQRSKCHSGFSFLGRDLCSDTKH